MCSCRSKLCIPHMKKSSNPHILNISPPLNLKPGWFSNHCGKPMHLQDKLLPIQRPCTVKIMTYLNRGIMLLICLPLHVYLPPQPTRLLNMGCQCVYWAWPRNWSQWALQSTLSGPELVGLYFVWWVCAFLKFWDETAHYFETFVFRSSVLNFLRMI